HSGSDRALRSDDSARKGYHSADAARIWGRKGKEQRRSRPGWAVSEKLTRIDIVSALTDPDGWGEDDARSSAMDKIAWAFLAAIVIGASGTLPAMAEDAALVVRPPDPMDSGKLLATGGVTQLEGAGGGGLVPWALI